MREKEDSVLEMSGLSSDLFGACDDGDVDETVSLLIELKERRIIALKSKQ